MEFREFKSYRIVKRVQTLLTTYEVDDGCIIHNERARNIDDIMIDVRKELGNELIDKMDYFSSFRYNERGSAGFSPHYHWIACFAVEGGSEGHYIHVEEIDGDGHRHLVILGKTFLGLDVALEIANKLTKIFYESKICVEHQLNKECR